MSYKAFSLHHFTKSFKFEYIQCILLPAVYFVCSTIILEHLIILLAI